MTDLAPPAIDIQGLAAGYGRTPVLRDITLTLRPGETVGLIGLNGAGKTTLLKAILMLVRPRPAACACSASRTRHRAAG